MDVTRWVLGTLLWEPAKFALLGSTKGLQTHHVRTVKREPSWAFQTMLKITPAPPTASNVLCERFRNIQDREPVWIVQLRMLRNQPSVTATVPPVNTWQVSTPKQTAHRVKIALCAAKENLLALQTKRMGATYVCPDTTVSKYVRICYAKRVQEANTATVCQVHITTRCALIAWPASTVRWRDLVVVWRALIVNVKTAKREGIMLIWEAKKKLTVKCVR